METVEIFGRSTSRLGFGGSLLGSTSAKESKQLLDAAFQLGIRHFDVAPLYGFGKSEQILGDAFRGRMDQITFTTKYGLSAPSNSGWIAPIHRLARTLLKQVPAVKRKIQAASARAAAGPAPVVPMTAVEARASLEHSLSELKTSRIDLFLLHEATPERLSDDSLLEFLLEAKHSGKIGEFGVGSESPMVQACLTQKPAYCNVVQFEWSVLSKPCVQAGSRPRIQHGSLGGKRFEFTQWLLADTARCDRWSQLAGIDLREPHIINRLMFKASLLNNPSCIVLFSTKSVRNIEDNIKTAENTSLDAAARAFQELVRTEYVT